MDGFYSGEGEGEDGDVIFLAEGLGGGSDLIGGLHADRARPVEAEKLSVVLSFYDTVGEERELIVVGEVNGRFDVRGIRRNAQGQAGFKLDLLAVQVRREMSGIRQGEGALGGELGTEAGGESAEAHVGEDAIEMIEELGWIVVIAPLGCADQNRRGHGSGSAFPAHVAEEDALAVSGQDAAAIEVATDLTDGVESHVDPHTGHGVEDARRQHALYLLGGMHLAGQNGALAGGLLLLAKQEEEQRDHQAEDRDRLAVGDSVAPMLLKIRNPRNVGAGTAARRRGSS